MYQTSPLKVIISITISFLSFAVKHISRKSIKRPMVVFPRDDKYREAFRTCREHISQTKRGLIKYYYRALCYFSGQAIRSQGVIP